MPRSSTRRRLRGDLIKPMVSTSVTIASPVQKTASNQACRQSDYNLFANTRCRLVGSKLLIVCPDLPQCAQQIVPSKPIKLTVATYPGGSRKMLVNFTFDNVRSLVTAF